mmetsp:Transcript_16447/g.44684  ORF Transcript_16447/g.44684 Transcript_16447/m.44684 type:complete len:226 (+) Transcript_16447:3936-4613(+)
MAARNSHRPAAADDFLRITSMSLTWSSARYGRAPSTFLAGSWLLSMMTLSPLRSTMKRFTSFIMLRAAAQSRFLGPSPRMARIAAVTSSTPCGGLASDRSSSSSFLLSESSAASAFCTAGIAASRSRVHSDSILPAFSAMTAHLAASSLAAAAAVSTLAFSPPTFSAMMSACCLAASTSTLLTLISSSSTATSLDVFSSLSRPLDSRSMSAASVVRSLASMLRYR